MEYDNDGDRFAAGFDAGSIVDGVVTLDESTGHFVIVDEDGKAFDPQAALSTVAGRSVRLTIVSREAMETMQKLLDATQLEKGSGN